MSRGAIWWRMVLPIRAVTSCLFLLLPFQRSCARQGEAGVDSSFKRKRALGKRAWNGQTLEASSSTGQQLRQGGREEGSQLGHRSNRRAGCPMPRPAPPHALRPCNFGSPNTWVPVEPLKSRRRIFCPFLCP